MNPIRAFVTGPFLALFALLFSATATFAKEEWHRGPDLEHPITTSDLILVARIGEIGETKTVSGGKAEYTIQQIKFEPVRTLKGVFARDTLQLTTEDLGGFDETGALQRGQLRLLLLGRSNRGYVSHNRQGNLDRSVPLVQNEKDPLLDSVKVLIQVTQQHDRGKKVTLLLDGLRQAKGTGAIPLLLALQRRAMLAAQIADAPAAVTRHLSDPESGVRETAVGALHALLEADYLGTKPLREGLAAALAALLNKPDLELSLRVAALNALGAVGPAAAANEAVAAHLKLDKPRDTFAERTAVVRAVGRLRLKAQLESVRTLLDALPLDGPHDLQSAAVMTLIALDTDQASKTIAQRLKKKVALGLGVDSEIYLIAELPRATAATLLLDALKLDLGASEKVAVARSAIKIADARLVPALSRMLSPRHAELRSNAFEALRKIDTEEAAKALLPHLKEEADLHRKLLISEFLGRHGMRDGYPYAMEHLSEPGLVEPAVSALAAIRDPKAAGVLRDILKSSNDTNWNSVAIRALGALGEKEMSAQFVEIVQDLKNPLSPAALIALGDLGEVKAIPKVREGLSSRNERLNFAAVRAAGKVLAVPGVKADELRDQLAALFADADANSHLRLSALDTLVAVRDARLDKALLAAVKDAGLEGSELMVRTEQQLRERKVKLY
jgi:HEAT repeat protein